MKKQGVKYDDEKPRYDLVPWNEFEEVVKVLSYGACKYDDTNSGPTSVVSDTYSSPDIN